MKIIAAAITIPILFGAATPITAASGSKSGKSEGPSAAAGPSNGNVPSPSMTPYAMPSGKSGKSRFRASYLSEVLGIGTDAVPESSAIAAAGYNQATTATTADNTEVWAERALAAAAFQESSLSLVTIDRDRSSDYKSSLGLMFEVEAREDVSITSLSFFTATSSKTWTEVYMRYGSYKGYTASSYGWEKIYSGKSQQRGTSSLTEVKFKTPVYIQQGETVSFYIVTPGLIISVDSGAKEGKSIAHNDEIKIYSGIALAYGMWEEGCMNGWQCIFSGRSFEGIIGYNVFTSPSTDIATQNFYTQVIESPGTLVVIDRDRSADYKSSLGLIFEVEALEDVSITSLSFFTGSDSKTWTEVYMRYGSYKGYTASSYGWEKIYSGKSQQRGTSSLTEVMLKTPVYIQKGATVSFYIVTPGLIISVDSGAKEGKSIAHNDAIKLYSGIALAYGMWEEGCMNGWQCIFSGRSFEGIISYDVFIVLPFAP